MPSLVDSSFADRYRTEGIIGEGGWGLVFRARHLLTGRRVAIKILHRNLSENSDSVKRFRLEAEAVMRVQHPNVVCVYDYGVDQERPYLVMELLDGQRLSELILLTGVDYKRALGWFIQIADGLAAAHVESVIHRDIKPSNIMIVENKDGTETAKILDFGLAKLVDDEERSQLTGTGQTVGTPGYMSPEQCMGEPLDARSDVYALGCVMYETLTGSQLVTGSALEAMYQHVQKQPPRMNQVPEALQDLVMKALEKAPADRYQSMEELREALQKLQSQSSLPSSTFTGKARQQWRLLRRLVTPKMAAVMVSTFVVSAVIAGFITHQADRSEKPAATKPANPNALLIIPAIDSQGGQVLANGMASLAAGKFNDLDRMVTEFSLDRTEYPDGRRKIDVLSHGLALLPLNSGPQGSYWQQKLESWLAANPKSVGARLILADSLAAQTWSVEQKKWCDLSKADRKQIAGRLKDSIGLCAEAARMQPDNPAVAALQLRIALLKDESRKDYDQLYGKFLRKFPKYRMLQFQKAIYLQPAWHGRSGDWERFAELSNDDLYSQIVWYVQSANYPLSTSELSWPRLKNGFAQNLHATDSLAVASELCSLAQLFKDKELAQDLLRKNIKTQVDLSVWQTPNNFIAARHWAFGE